jgi:tetratricopeptide (TPR) repeat protein
VQVEANHADAAVQLLRTAVKRLPHDQPLLAQLAQLLTKGGELEEARQEAQVAQRLSAQGVRQEQTTLESLEPASGQAAARGDPAQNRSTAPDSLESQAWTLAQERKYSEALAAIQRAIELDSHQARCLLLEGEIYQRTGDQFSEMRSFLEAHEIDPRPPVPIYPIGMSLFALGFYNNDPNYYDRAARHFRMTLELDPRFGKAEFMQGMIAVVKFALNDAKPHYEKAFQLDPKHAYYHLRYGVLLSRLGDHPPALHEMELAAELYPNYVLTHFSLGNLYSRLGEFEKARDELESAVKLDPHLANAFYSLGVVYRHLGAKEMARKAFDRFESVRQQKSAPDPRRGDDFVQQPARGDRASISGAQR